MDVAVVGLGKIGLPLAVQIAGRGHRVHGHDVDSSTVGIVNAGLEPFPGEAGLAPALRDVVGDGRLRATTDGADAVSSSDAVVVVVPLVVDRDSSPDFRALDEATEVIGASLRPGTLVSFETTMPVGTTRGRLVPRLAELSGLTVGRDLYVCHSPERVSSGRVLRDLRRYPKLVGATDPASADRAVHFYDDVLDFDPRPDLPRSNGVWDLGSCESAELAKLVETTYRDVNIALANEFAAHAEVLGLDVHTVIEAANSQPFSHVHRPGIAVGGHCIPVYPRLYLAGDPDARIPLAARQVNEAVPTRVVEGLRARLGDIGGLRVAILGLSYRGGVKEAAFSGAFTLASALREVGSRPSVHDPLFADDEVASHGLVPHRWGSPVDVVIVQADHHQYRDVTPQDFPGVRALVDGRGIVDLGPWEALPTYVIGRGWR